MIDTIILTIPKDKMRTLDNRQGYFENWELESTGKGWKKYRKNTTRKEFESGLSFIKLTWYSRNNRNGKFVQNVNIEFSATKLIKGNNINELNEQDLILIAPVLQKRLQNMGELVDLKDIENAEISSCHPAKNIILTDGFTSSGIIRELSKINISKKFDLTDVIFANDGLNLQIRNEAHSIVFYDKIADLIKDKKKAIDRDQIFKQQSLFDEIKKEQPTLEVLRIEMRLKKRKMKEIMKKLGFIENPTLKDILKKEVCQKIVKWYWEEIIKGENIFLFELINSPKRLLRKILKNERNIQPKQAIFLVALDILCKEGDGIRELREILEKYTKQRNWYRYTNGIKLLNKITNKKSLHSWVHQIDDAINKFEPINIRAE